MRESRYAASDSILVGNNGFGTRSTGVGVVVQI